MESPTIGRILHFVLPNGDHRPCIIARVWPGEFAAGKEDGYNIQVFTDGSNDASVNALGDAARAGIVWRTSVRLDETCVPGTIHWPER